MPGRHVAAATNSQLFHDVNIVVVGGSAGLGRLYCLDLGKALTEICAKSKKRIAILASGGLSHDPRGARAGWIDEPLDHAVLEAFAEGEPDRLEALYKINSDTYHGGTGEIRNW